jgi:YgiT-type zinc finger domain-containing protein
MTCPSCSGSQIRALEGPYHFTESGLDWIYLVGLPHGVCETCGDHVVSLPNPELLFDLIARVILERKRPLHGSEIRFLRGLIGWTQSRLATEIGKGRVAIARWESGEKQVPPQTDIMMRVVWLHAYLEQKRENGLGLLTEESLRLLNNWSYKIGAVIREMRRNAPGTESISIDVATRQVVTTTC